MLYADQWNAVAVDLGPQVAAGKTIDRDPARLRQHRGREDRRPSFRGWLDDVAVDARAGRDRRLQPDQLRRHPARHQRVGLVLARQQPADQRRCRTASTSSRRSPTPPPTRGSTRTRRSNNAREPARRSRASAISHEPQPVDGRPQPDVGHAGRAAGGVPTGDAERPRTRLQPRRRDRAAGLLPGQARRRPDRAEMAPTDHGGVMRFTFPDRAATGSLVVDTVDDNGTLHHRPGDGTFTGWVDNGSGLSAGRSRMFVSGAFDRAPATGTARRPTARATSPSTPRRRSTVTLRLATSFISLDQAKKNLDLEVTGPQLRPDPRAARRGLERPPRRRRGRGRRPRRSWSRSTPTCTG